jgi:hypothetical protein
MSGGRRDVVGAAVIILVAATRGDREDGGTLIESSQFTIRSNSLSLSHELC